jgi:hypothetical protein
VCGYVCAYVCVYVLCMRMNSVHVRVCACVCVCVCVCMCSGVNNMRVMHYCISLSLSLAGYPHRAYR